MTPTQREPAGGGRPLLVQKYGGSSLATAERIVNAARRVVQARTAGRRLVVVVSAMGDTTDDLIQLARSVSRQPVERELDHLLSTGEMVSATLMAMALTDLGVPAVSLTAAQAGIKTTAMFSKARITGIDPKRIVREVGAGRVCVVTGFQGITEEMDVTTLGRGGSDTTAVALAWALGAECCEIYTDVEGVYTADPRVEPRARPLERISYEEMLELAQLGARVMHPRAVELGLISGIPIVVRSTFSQAAGTVITATEEADAVEIRKHVRGIAHDTDVAKITLGNVPDRPGIAAAIFQPLADAAISVDVIAQAASLEGFTEMSFTINRNDLPKALPMMQRVAREIGASTLDTSDTLAKVSIVGTGMQSAPGYAAQMFDALARAKVNIDMISTSDIRITCVVSQAEVEQAVRVLHHAFELDTE
jgi:aspartate kinase